MSENNKEYLRLKAPAEESFVEKKSRFIGCASPVETEQEALDFIDKIKAQHRTATHHCYAYTIGENCGIMRYCDDGEPRGTAGVPILEAIRAKGLHFAVVVVVRYFGGVLLGAGGLVRAYTKGACLSLEAAGSALIRSCQRLELKLSYDRYEKLSYALKADKRCLLQEPTFTDEVSISLICAACESRQIAAKLTDLCEGRLKIDITEPFSYPWPHE